MPDNLKILFHLTNIFNKELFKESLTAVMIANEIDQVQKDNPTLSNGIFSSPLTEKIQSSLAITFYDANMKTDKTLRKNLNQYINLKKAVEVSKMSFYTLNSRFKNIYLPL